MRPAIPTLSDIPSDIPSDDYYPSNATNATVSPSRSRWPCATIKLSVIIVAVSTCAVISKIHVPKSDAFIVLGVLGVVLGVVLAIVSVIRLCRTCKTRNDDFARVQCSTAVSSLTTTHVPFTPSQLPTAQEASIPVDATSGVTTAPQSLSSSQQRSESTIYAVPFEFESAILAVALPAVSVECESVIQAATLVRPV